MVREARQQRRRRLAASQRQDRSVCRDFVVRDATLLVVVFQDVAHEVLAARVSLHAVLGAVLGELVVLASLGLEGGRDAPVEQFHDGLVLHARLHEAQGFYVAEDVADPGVVVGILEAAESFAKGQVTCWQINKSVCDDDWTSQGNHTPMISNVVQLYQATISTS